jgi:hypothetical protein
MTPQELNTLLIPFRNFSEYSIADIAAWKS